MAMKIIRRADGAETRWTPSAGQSAEIPYSVLSYTTKDEAFRAVYNACPRTYKGLYYLHMRWEDRENKNAEIIVVYSALETGEPTSTRKRNRVSFDCTGGSRHVNFALAQRSVMGRINAGGAIGWNGKIGAEAEITGYDLPVGQNNKRWVRTMKASEITTRFEDRVSALVGKVNKSKFKGRPRGSVMFLGMTMDEAEEGSSQLIDVQFLFAINPPERTFVNGIDVGEKEGFDIVSTISKNTTNTNGSPSVEIADIHVSRAAEYGDFSALGV